jgi:hypothetical protein
MSGCKRLGAHDRENFGDSNCSLPLEMIIFNGQSVQNTSRMLKKSPAAPIGNIPDHWAKPEFLQA